MDARFLVERGALAGAAGAVRELWPRGADGLPPGQGAVSTFPRFGVHTGTPPAVPALPRIELRGAVDRAADLDLAELMTELPRTNRTTDLHCVAGWTARDLRWEGVAFRTVWELAILPRAQPRTGVTHLVLCGRDGFRSALLLEDALADDVLLADRLDGAPLTGRHGAPIRLVSPRQYGYMSAKHLARIELRTGEPGRATHVSRLGAFGLGLVASHPRARVEHEERHRHIPGWAIRPLYKRGVLPLFAARIGTRRL